MKDQLSHWNNAHANQQLHKHSAHETDFARYINTGIPPLASILELGCGEGNDSIYFAEQGHAITATDFSNTVLEQNNDRLTHPNLTFSIQDISQPLQFDNASFDVIYARLSLHYFTNETTASIFREIARVLKPGGMLCFMCKSTADHLHGQGQEIERNMYELEGHVRHFFSKEYAMKLLHEARLNEEDIQTGEEMIYDHLSGFIKVMARKSTV